MLHIGKSTRVHKHTVVHEKGTTLSTVMFLVSQGASQCVTWAHNQATTSYLGSQQHIAFYSLWELAQCEGHLKNNKKRLFVNIRETAHIIFLKH